MTWPTPQCVIVLRYAFTDPERLRPAKTRQLLTEEAAEKFASLAQRLRERGHKPQEVAHFVNRLVFCMFAEDVNLLPDKMFERMLTLASANPSHFEPHAKTLFTAMKSGGWLAFERSNGSTAVCSMTSGAAFPLLNARH